MLNYLTIYEVSSEKKSINKLENFLNIKYDLINLFMKNNLMYIINIYIKYQKNINNSIYNNSTSIMNIYQLFNNICNYVFNIVCVSNN